MRPLIPAVAALLVVLTACGEPKSGFVVGNTAGGACDVSLDTLNGTTWVMSEAQADRTSVENPQARVRFFQEDGKQKAHYTVKSLGDVYTYDCAVLKEGEWLCKEKPKLQDWCQALEAWKEGACKPDALRELGAADATDEDIAAAMKAAVAIANQFRGGDQWQHFRLNNNNLGNKLQGQLYVKPNAKRCELKVTDMYMTVYEGKRVEDSNPVGTNPFVKAEGEFLWEHCADGRNLVDLGAPERVPPDQIPPAPRPHGVGDPVHYVYYGDAAVQPEAGCTYSFDSYAQWRPAQKDVAVSAGPDGKLDWRAAHTFSEADGLKLVDPSRPVGVFTLVRHKTCGGAREKIDVLCNASMVN